MSEQKIGEIARKIVKEIKKGVKEDIRVFDIESLWYKIIDENLKGHCYVIGEKKGDLIVKVDGSCYLSELKRKKEKILKKLKEAGATEIKNIRFLI